MLKSNPDLEWYLAEISKFPLLSKEDEQRLGCVMRSNASKGMRMHARQELIESNLRLVVYAAKRYAKRGPSVADLVQAGNEGLVMAADKFEPSRGLRFVTLAYWWIEQRIRELITNDRRIIYIPHDILSLANIMAGVSNKLERRRHRAPTLRELLHALHQRFANRKWGAHSPAVLAARVARAQGAMSMRVHSLDAHVPQGHSRSGDPITYGEIHQYTGLRPEEEADHSSTASRIRELIDKRLTPRQAEVIRLRFGFGGEPLTLREIGERFGVSREYIRVIEKAALARLKSYRPFKSLAAEMA